jgi:hypothetical protein
MPVNFLIGMLVAVLELNVPRKPLPGPDGFTAVLADEFLLQ